VVALVAVASAGAVAVRLAVVARPGVGEMLQRIIRHLTTTRWHLRQVFTPAVMRDIERAIHDSERTHAGEIRVALEAALDLDDLLARVTVRGRALEVFNQLRVWDTEQDNGILIYVLHAEHALEIVADRGYNARVDAATWAALCAATSSAFQAARYGPGLVRLIEQIGALVAREFPPCAEDMNELPDAALFL
jgi:uncharacterized membrane protein